MHCEIFNPSKIDELNKEMISLKEVLNGVIKSGTNERNDDNSNVNSNGSESYWDRNYLGIIIM